MVRDCPSCHGFGTVPSEDGNLPDFDGTVCLTVECEHCLGTGREIVCDSCREVIYRDEEYVAREPDELITFHWQCALPEKDVLSA